MANYVDDFRLNKSDAYGKDEPAEKGPPLIVEKTSEVRDQFLKPQEENISFVGRKIELDERQKAYNMVMESPDSQEAVLAAIKRFPEVITKASCTLLEQPGFVLKAVGANFSSFSYFIERRCPFEILNEVIDRYSKDRAFVLEAVKAYGEILAILPKEYLQDREVVLAAVTNCGKILELTPQFQDDDEIVRAALKNDCTSFKFASHRYRDDPLIVCEAALQDKNALSHASDRLRNDSAFILKLVEEVDSKDPFGGIFCGASEALLNNGEFIFKVLEKCPHDLPLIPKEFRESPVFMLNVLGRIENPSILFKDLPSSLLANREFVLKVSEFDCKILKNVSDISLKSWEFILEAIERNPEAYQYATSCYKINWDFFLNAIEKNPRAILYAPERFKNRESYLSALHRNAFVFEVLPEEFRDDDAFAHEAIQGNPEMFQFVSVRLQNNPEFISQVIQRNPDIYRNLPEAMRDDAQIALAAIQRNSELFGFVSEGLRNNRAFILQAVTHNSVCFSLLSNEMRDDEEIVNLAISRDVNLFEHASLRLRSSPVFISQYTFMHRNSDILLFATEAIQNDAEFREMIAMISGAPIYDARPYVYFSVDPEKISENPLEIVHLLLPKMKEGMPRIQYNGSPGQDVGGLTRDFVARLMEAICDLEKQHIPAIQEDGKIIPLAEDDNQDQHQAYEVIGGMFAFALERNPAITIGNYFQPRLFEMIHSLSSDELTALPKCSNFENIPAETVDGLFNIHARTLHGINEEDIPKILADEVPQHLKNYGYETKNDFFGQEFKKMALASVTIAKSLYGHLKHPDQWDVLKSRTPTELGERIEGKLEHELVKKSLAWEGINVNAMGFLQKWINDSSLNDLEKLVFAITGSKTLAPGAEIKINLYNASNRLPAFHTCFFKMDLPNNYVGDGESEDKDYQKFKTQLEQSLCSIEGSGFQDA